MVLYKRQYRIESNRLKHHTYAKGVFFVTICTKQKLQWFGVIKKGKVVLSEMGEVVEQCLFGIPKHFPHAHMDSFVVMPNHIHVLMRVAPTVETRDSRVSTKEASPHNNPAKTFSLQPKGLGSIVNQFKGTVTKQVHALGYPEFQWQPRYHDRIIRAPGELAEVRKYIARNPDAWDKETIPWHADAATWNP